jgi:hypothetical protein
MSDPVYKGVRITPGNEAMKRRHVDLVIAASARHEEEVVRALTRAADLGLPVSRTDVERAMSDKASADRANTDRQRDAAARIAIGLDDDAQPIHTVRRFIEALRGPDGRPPTLEDVAERMRRSPRTVSTYCQPFGGYKAVANRK